jgi:hypothetical protein
VFFDGCSGIRISHLSSLLGAEVYRRRTANATGLDVSTQ